MFTFRDVIRCFKSHSIYGYCLRTTYARFAAFMALISSLLFTLSSAIIIDGVGLNSQASQVTLLDAESTPGKSCYAMIYICIFLYGLTKVSSCFRSFLDLTATC
jgi:hypothetical protein